MAFCFFPLSNFFDASINIGVAVFPSELFDGAEKMDCYVSPEDYKALTENPFVLGKALAPLFYGAACQDVNTIGGFANWVQDAEYTTCPHCGKPMKYLAQIQWDTVFDLSLIHIYPWYRPSRKSYPYRQCPRPDAPASGGGKGPAG